ncbi:MAG: L-rhamnose mutarotase [Propionivibrio sp.]
MRRFGQIIQVKPEKLDEYKRLHANPWPEVNAMLKACNISNYSIYHHDGFLFAYFEYLGSDFEADMTRMANDPKTQAWWALTDPCQEPVKGRRKDEWWLTMEEVFRLD